MSGNDMTLDQAEQKYKAAEERHRALTTELRAAEAEVEVRGRAFDEAKEARNAAEDGLVAETPALASDPARLARAATEAAYRDRTGGDLTLAERRYATADRLYREASEELGRARSCVERLREDVRRGETELGYATDDLAAARRAADTGRTPERRRQMEAHFDDIIYGRRQL